MQYTPNYNLMKPADNETADIAVLNQNTDKIDTTLFSMIPKTQKGAAGGVAELGNDGKVPAAQLPSYVDDVLEYATLTAFPASGEPGKIYVAQDSNKTYRWSGSAYVEISASLALGETSSSAYPGDKGKAAYTHSQTTGNPHGMTAAQVGAYTKEESLFSATKTLLGLPSTATPDDAFVKLAMGAYKYGYSITLTFPDGTPLANRAVGGITSSSGAAVSTGADGVVFGVSNSANPTINVSITEYLDLLSISQAISSTGVITNASIVVPKNTSPYRVISQSGNYKFSSSVKYFDAGLVGAGGGGAGIGNYFPAGAGGGAGGEITNLMNIQWLTDKTLNIQIGAGGSGSSSGNGDSGGTTSLVYNSISTTASGGNGGRAPYSNNNAGAGGTSANGGNGGAGGYTNNSSVNGSPSTTYPLNDPALQASGGGGGSCGTNVSYDYRTSGGGKYGGIGACQPPRSEKGGTGYGGGGGGGSSPNSDWGGGNGYQGAVYVKWRY